MCLGRIWWCLVLGDMGLLGPFAAKMHLKWVVWSQLSLVCCTNGGCFVWFDVQQH